MPDIELQAGAWSARLRPAVGGAIAALDLGGTPVLRAMAAGADHPLESGCFPLAPYCNRIAGGRAEWDNVPIAIAPNLPPQAHPLHGESWLRAWRVIRSDGSSALLEDDYTGAAEGDWPFAYRIHQHIALDETGCTIRLIAENRADRPAPIGLGLHPYFRRAADTRLQFDARRMHNIDSEFLPDGTSEPADCFAPWSEGAPLPDTLVDHCFEGWSGTARIEDGSGHIAVRGFGAPHVHVYAPPGGEELCIEPVNHLPDAINRVSETMPVVRPGCAVGLAMRIEATGHR